MKLSKKSIRKEILAKTQDYLCNGGLIEEVLLGESGQNTKEPIVRPAFKIDETSKNKIYLTDVVATIDARKLATTKSRLLTKNHSRRHKKSFMMILANHYAKYGSTRGSDQNVEMKISFASLIHLPGQE